MRSKLSRCWSSKSCWALILRLKSIIWLFVSSDVFALLTALAFRSDKAFSRSANRRDAPSSSKLVWIAVTLSCKADTSTIKLLNCSRVDAISLRKERMEAAVDVPLELEPELELPLE